MAIPFYNQGDQDIYAGGEHYIPQEQYRLNYTPSQLLASTVGNTGGVTGTQAARPYFPQGGGGGGGGGNVFGYGTTVSPVSLGAYGEPGYSGGLSGDVQQVGWGRQDEPGGGAYLRPRKEIPGFASMAMSFVPGGNFLRRMIENKMNPEYDPNKNLSGYAAAGLDDTQKGVYNTLAGEGLLFQGQSGLKTATGKNYGAPGYFEGQQDVIDKTISKYGSIQGAKDYFAANPKTTNFLQTQLKEALAVTGKLDEQEEYDKKVATRNREQRIQNLKEQGKKDIHHGDGTTGDGTSGGTDIGGGWTRTDTGGGGATFTGGGGQTHQGFSNTPAGFAAAAESEGSFAQGGRIGLSKGMTPFMAWVKDQYGVNVGDIKDWNFYSGLANEWKRLEGKKHGGLIGYFDGGIARLL